MTPAEHNAKANAATEVGMNGIVSDAGKCKADGENTRTGHSSESNMPSERREGQSGCTSRSPAREHPRGQ